MTRRPRPARTVAVTAVAVLACLLAACGAPAAAPEASAPTRTASTESPAPAVPSESSEPPTPALLVADVQRSMPVDAPVTELAQMLDRFGYDLLQAAADQAGNAVLSPASVAMAFGMARAGAAGATATQMDDVFGWPGDVHAAFNALERQVVTGEAPPPLPTQETTRDASQPRPPVVHIANGLFAQAGMPVNEAFLELLGAHYGAGVRTVDFTTPDAAKQTIDAWVREQTAERIEELFAALPPTTRLVLANAVYLKADWEQPFAEQPVHPAPFTLADGEVVEVDTMGHLTTTRYAKGDGWQAVELRYAGGELAMQVLVPDAGGSPRTLLAPESLEAVDAAMAEGIVDLTLPRWDFATSVDLIPALVALGLELPFTPAADFSGISESGLLIDQAVHRATITVDEWGTEAAAVTGLGFVASAPPAPDAVIHVDRSFAFVIRHLPTGAPLFLGHVADPRSSG